MSDGHEPGRSEASQAAEAVERMTAAAADLLAQLDGPALEAARRPFPDEALRRDWSYVPRPRQGPALDELTRPQRKAVHRLLASGLAFHAYAQVAAVMALEDVLDAAEGGSGRRRRDDYQVIVFGDPRGTTPWGWRFEGHHVSLNLTLVDGEVSATPCFLGANPAAVRHAGTPVVRPLGQEEDLARALLAALDGPQRNRAVVADVAPADITTRSAPGVAVPPAEGVSAAELTGEAAALLDALVGLYLDRLPAPLAARQRRRLTARDTDPVHFAWAGPAERGAGHYYRLSGPNLLVEYDCTQNQANHVHTVWRDPERDFGEDLLAEHYARDHAG